MANLLVVGTQWGDEGKGKIVDVLAKEADIIARFQGGPNAGHTVVYDAQKFILHIVPSGILHPGRRCVIGDGVVVDPGALLAEIDGLGDRGVEVQGRLFLSKNAHLIMPYHKAIDGESEKALGEKGIGTTRRGIGPTYADKAARKGIRFCDLVDEEIFRQKLEVNLTEKNFLLERFYGAAPFVYEEILTEFKGYREKLAHYVTDTRAVLKAAFERSERILFEGAQGTLLDISHGTYPYVTSSTTSVGGVCSGLGIPPKMIDGVLGVVKAYTTRVGEGPFPTEIQGYICDMIRRNGSEFGSTTGRPRRCGWLDFVALRHSVWINGIDHLAITRLDVLDGLEELKVCTAYRLTGQTITDTFPPTEVLQRCEPVYESLPGWKTKTEGMQDYEQLPQEAKEYVSLISETLKVPIAIISTGESRDSTITLQSLF
ncbi:MAG: adenylosuccinate synthase [bacterium]